MRGFSLRFLTRSGCHLCDDARPILMAVANRLNIEVIEVDIDSDDELVSRYGLRIPVILGPDDQVVAEGTVDVSALLRSIKRLN